MGSPWSATRCTCPPRSPERSDRSLAEPAHQAEGRGKDASRGWSAASAARQPVSRRPSSRHAGGPRRRRARGRHRHRAARTARPMASASASLYLQCRASHRPAVERRWRSAPATSAMVPISLRLRRTRSRARAWVCGCPCRPQAVDPGVDGNGGLSEPPRWVESGPQPGARDRRDMDRISPSASGSGTHSAGPTAARSAPGRRRWRDRRRSARSRDRAGPSSPSSRRTCADGPGAPGRRGCWW